MFGGGGTRSELLNGLKLIKIDQNLNVNDSLLEV
jgi:hypothetical protein